MLKEFQNFKLKDESGKNDLIIEVNWDKGNKKTNDCKILKLIYPDKTQAFIKREYLNSLLFVIGVPEEQRKMLPQTITRAKWYETTLSIEAKKDIRKGEKIIFPIKITLPAEREEVIGKVEKKSNLLVPVKNKWI